MGKSFLLSASVLFLFLTSFIAPDLSDISVQMVYPEKINPGEQFTLQLKVNKGSLSGAAVLQQYLPEGFTATAIETKGGKFTFENRCVKFSWKKLPEINSFIIAYYVRVDGNCSGVKILTGELSYFENGAPGKIILPACQITLPGNATVSKPQAKHVLPEISETKQVPPMDVEQMQTKPSGMSTVTPSQHTGNYYRIQIAATLRSPERNSGFFKSKMDIDYPVDMTLHEGWKKYLIGEYASYKDAEKVRTEILSKAPGAFLVTYKNGSRVSPPGAVAMDSR